MDWHIYGMHEYDSAWADILRRVGVRGWCVTTHDVQQQSGEDFARMAERGIRPIARLNWGYEPTGTLPKPDRYADYAKACAAFVAASRGCRHWIIGNEPNLSVEWPDGEQIDPWEYVDAFRMARRAIRSVRNHAEDHVIVAGIAPWSLDGGDWLQYFRQVLEPLGARGCEGIALHTYTHGTDPGLITSDAKMLSHPLRYYNFRAYRDFLSTVPLAMRGLPVYITETDQLERWRNENTGWVQEAYTEIDAWNRMPGTQKIYCLTLYRWPHYDKFGIQGNDGVLSDWEAAMQHRYVVPDASTASTTGNDLYVPLVTVGEGPSVPTEPDPEPDRDWDARLDKRGVKILPTSLMDGDKYLRVVRGRWYDVEEAKSVPDHHILIDILDEDGNRMVGEPLSVVWPSGAETIWTEAKPGERWSANKPMSKSRNEFSVQPVGSIPSELVFGIGMGADMGDGFNPAHHTSTELVWQIATYREQAATDGESGESSQDLGAGSDVTANVPRLSHPVADPAFRRITQMFGVNEADYKQYTIDGVALRGHNGIDFATPMRTPIAAVDDGKVVEAAFDPDGYGEYIKIEHVWGESLYAHLCSDCAAYVEVGDTVYRGQDIALSGNTGNSTGPHLHFAMRVKPFNRADGWGGYTDPLPYLTQPVAMPAMSRAEIVQIVRDAAKEFKVEPNLLLSQVLGESSFDPMSYRPDTQVKGLGNIAPLTWAEWAPYVGASDPFNPRDNARVMAAYLAWCRKQVESDWQALVAYGWGIGNFLHEPNNVPDAWRAYANEIMHGKWLLDIVAAG